MEKTAVLDSPLHAFGVEIEEICATSVTARLVVTEKCCQPYKVLHGGVSALIAEAVASIGAGVASGFKRVAGIQLSINHLRTASIGDLLLAHASPSHVGSSIQVWDVRLWKVSESTTLVASSTVTFYCNLPVPDHAIQAPLLLKRFAKL